MAKTRDFFMSDSWDEDARAQFEERILRYPKRRRATHFQDKARALFHNQAGDPIRKQAAFALIERALVETPEDAGAHAELLRWLAVFHKKQGATAEAIAALRRSIALLPGIRQEQYDPAPEILLCRCLIDIGRYGESRDLFDRFYRDLATNQMRAPTPYAELEEREVYDASGAIEHDPENAAEGIRAIYEFAEPPEPAVPGIMTAGRAALAALDAHFRIEDYLCERRFHPRVIFSPNYREQLLIPQLGAFLGRALIRECDGRWAPASPLLKSRVLVGGSSCNPFQAAYDAVYYEVPLVQSYDRLANG